MEDTSFADKLSLRLYEFYQKQLFCDTLIVIDNQTNIKRAFWAHSVVLAAASADLCAALKTQSSVVVTSIRYCVPLSNCDPVAVDVVLRYLYTGKLVAPPAFREPNESTKIFEVFKALGFPMEKLIGVRVSYGNESASNGPAIQIQTEKSAEKTTDERSSGVQQHTKVTKLVNSNSTALNSVADSFYGIEAQEVAAIDVDANFLPRSPIEKRMPQSAEVQSTCLEEESSDSPAHGECADEVECTTSQEINDSTNSVANTNTRGEVSRKRLVPASAGSNGVQRNPPIAVVCSVCNSTLAKRDTLINHMLTQHDVHACRKCDGTFQSADDLATHVEADHKSNVSVIELPYVCHLCDRSYHSSTSLQRHMTLSHSTSDKPHLCDLCGLSFSSVKSLRKHFKGHELPERCERCDTRFRHSYELKEHLLACLTGVGKPFKCDTCGGFFKRLRSLRRHEQSHIGKCVCHICGRSYGHKTSLVKHMHASHELTPHKCPVCDKEYSYPSRLEQHIKKHERMKEKSDSLSCSVCGRKFLTARKLARHMVDHQELHDEMVQCGTCGKQFKNRHCLRSHVIIHSEVKYSCPASGCSKQFTLRSNAYRHTRQAHGMGREEYDAAVKSQQRPEREDQSRGVMLTVMRGVVERTVPQQSSVVLLTQKK